MHSHSSRSYSFCSVLSVSFHFGLSGARIVFLSDKRGVLAFLLCTVYRTYLRSETTIIPCFFHLPSARRHHSVGSCAEVCGAVRRYVNLFGEIRIHAYLRLLRKNTGNQQKIAFADMKKREMEYSAAACPGRKREALNINRTGVRFCTEMGAAAAYKPQY